GGPESRTILARNDPLSARSIIPTHSARRVLRCSNRWNIFPPMRIGALVELVCVAACRTRSLARMAQQSDSVDLALLVPHGSTDSALVAPRVITTPTGGLFWLRAADTLR